MGPSAHVAFCLCRRSSHRTRSPEYQRKPDPHLVWTADDILRDRLCFGVLEKIAARGCHLSYSFPNTTLRRHRLANAVRLPAGQSSNSVPSVSAWIHAINCVVDKAERNYCIGYAMGRRLVFRSQIVVATEQVEN